MRDVGGRRAGRRRGIQEHRAASKFTRDHMDRLRVRRGCRRMPDVSFTASWNHDPYLIALNGGGLLPAGGTSIATPFFAGVVALLNQYLTATRVEAKPGLGNINPKLYQLAQTAPTVFHDVTTGDNIIPCWEETEDCTTGSYGFAAGPGYDQVTGLGSI